MRLRGDVILAYVAGELQGGIGTISSETPSAATACCLGYLPGNPLGPRHGHSATSTVWAGDQISVTLSPGATAAASWFWVRSLISAPPESSRMKVETAPA